MKILVVGSGGREHALAWGIARSGHTVIAAPGNPGIAEVAACHAVSVKDLDGLLRLADAEDVDLVVVGPEDPLAAGLADRGADRGVAVFGPTAAGARIESSKTYAKEVMARGGVPTARADAVSDLDTALRLVRRIDGPCVVKADGLAAGKGVTVAADAREAAVAVRACFEGRFGTAGATVLVEELLEGPEVSLLVLSDGKTLVPLPPAQDHKRIGEGDTGPNTGGMGAYSPVPVATPAVVETVMERIVEPTIWSLAKDGVEYRGVLYAGLMLTAAGPQVIEFNCRFGDPEAQAVIPRLDCDLGAVLGAVAAGALATEAVDVAARAALTVVAAAPGYPEGARTGDRIDGLGDAADVPDTVVFHAGTAMSGEDVVTAGGRVLAVTGLGDGLVSARDAAYAAVDRIGWPGMQVRHDIGRRALGE